MKHCTVRKHRIAHQWAFCALLAAGLVASSQALALKAVTIDVNPGISTGGVNYSTPGASDQAVYSYTINDGQAVSDTIPVQICMTAYETGWTSIAFTFGTPSAGLPGVTVSANQTFSALTSGSPTPTPDCRSGSISIATGALASGPIGTSYVSNITFGETGHNPTGTANRPNLNFVDIKKIQIKVTVLPVTSNVSCFLTDSDGNFLTDCSGVPVDESASDAGRFALVVNKRGTQVASNPGQFYYNLVWWNKTGTQQTVDVDIARDGVVPHGQQALHAAVFNGYLEPLTPGEFAAANANGIPEGHDDQVTGVQVPAGASLLVTYHLEWAGLGQPVPGDCATTCAEANQFMGVVGVVSGAGIAEEECSVSARGYRKK